MTNITTTSETKEITTKERVEITIKLSELLSFEDVTQCDEDKFEDPLWEDIKILFSQSCEEYYHNGDEVKKLLDDDNKDTYMMVELEDGTIEGFGCNHIE